MDLSELDREQRLTLVGVVAVILGIVAVPPLMQHFYDVSAIRVAFVVIVIYAAFSWYLKSR